MRLFFNEVARGISRRTVRVLFLLGMVILTILGVVLFLRTDPPADAEANAALRHATAIRQCVDMSAAGVPAVPGIPVGGDPAALDRTFLEEACRDSIPVEQFRRTFDLQDVWPADGDLNGLRVMFVVGVLISMLGGASMVGAEWRAGTMTTTLLWEPRRIRLGIAKMVGAGVVMALFFIGLSAFQVIAVLPSALLHGSAAVDRSWLVDFAPELAMALGVMVAAGTIGAALAMIGRNTAAAIGVAFLYFVIIEELLTAWKPAWRYWFLGPNNQAVIAGGVLTDATTSPGIALLRVGAYALVLMLVALALFRRRDITSTA